MGQKVNPIGLRLGIHRKWNSNWFFDFTNYSKFLYTHFDIEKFFRGFLYYYPIKTLLINCQIIKLPSNKLYIFVFFYRLRKKKKRSIKRNFIKPLKYSLKRNSLNKYYSKSIFKKFINNKYQLSYLNLNKLYKNCKVNNNNINWFNLIKNEYNNIKKCMKISKQNINYLINLKGKINNNLYKKLIKLYLQKVEILKLKSLKLNIFFNILILLNKKINLINNSNKNNNTLKLYKNINYKLNISEKKINKLQKNINDKIFLCNQLKFISKLKKIDNLNKNKYIIVLFYNLYLSNKYKKNNKNFQNYIFTKKYKNNNNKFKQIKAGKNKKKIFFNKQAHFKLQHIKKFLSKLTNLKTSVFFINSLSFIKFYYQLEQKNEKIKSNPNILLSIQRQMLNSYRYNAIYIQDFVNIAFISMILKNPKFLTQFIAFQFKKLPKNKRQLKLIQLITKTIQIIGKERKEILGLKIKFKGRINKKKRARSINFKKGIITLQTHSSRVEYGYTNAYTKSGSLGIKLWIFYEQNFKNELKKNFLQYIKYSNMKKK